MNSAAAPGDQRPTIDDVRRIIAGAIARARQTLPAGTSDDAVADVILRDLRAAGIKLVFRPDRERRSDQ